MTLGLRTPDAADLERLAALGGSAGAIQQGDDRLAPYLKEPRDQWQGQAAAVLRPETTAQVSALLAYCNQAHIPVVALSGGTGLVGGQTLPDGPAPVILSLERMNRIRAVLPDDGALIAEAGCILSDIKAEADRIGRLFPLSLASEGSCRIGGNLATNAGGVQVLRYGNTRDLVLDVEAVLADGSVIAGPKVLRKNNMGLDLRHLLIGSEGTLGIITAASLKLFPKPGETVTALLTVPDPAAAVRLLHVLGRHLGDAITGFELINGRGVGFIQRFYPDWRDPLEGSPPWRVLMEAVGPVGGGMTDRMEGILGDVFEQGLATDGVLAQNEAQRAAFWWMRETIPECNRKVGAILSTDIAVPTSRIPDYLAEADRRVAAIETDITINSFGHIGDGNLHYNLYPGPGRSKSEYGNVKPELSRVLHDLAAEMDGSIAAEHGIGRLKLADYQRLGDPAALAAMRAIKSALDPNGILNPGAALPDQSR
ncbi:MAG: FAD-binding oxidoreductase [Pseudomonadota bacterium]